MQTKLFRAKTGVLLQVVLFLFLGTNSYSFSDQVFQTINTHFKSIGLNRNFSQETIKTFQNRSKFLNGYKSTTFKIPLPYFYFQAEKPTYETILWVGGIHPDELAALNASLALGNRLIKSPKSYKFNKNIIFIPLVNIDGFLKGVKDRNYAYRENAIEQDVNRSFYAYDELSNYKSNNEAEFILALIKKYQPKYWVIPHSSIHILDFDGLYDSLAISWLNDIYEATKENGGEEIPIKRYRNFAPPNSKKNWSIGKLASHLGDIRSLTYEFPGPGDYPSPDNPDRNRIIILRKHLGRFENNAWLAEQYFHDYLPSLLTSLFISYNQ
tara:strand:+ start:9153 stop:10127 length:975 start_codon:yes stop_codon:yes gene_type:complete